jgi:hypothetical protein
LEAVAVAAQTPRATEVVAVDSGAQARMPCFREQELREALAEVQTTTHSSCLWQEALEAVVAVLMKAETAGPAAAEVVAEGLY